MVEAMEIQKGFKKTEVGVIPNDWKLLPVSKFGEVKRGAGSQYIKYVNYNGIRFIRINDFFEDSPVYVSPTVDMMRFAITESDVLFAGTGASAGASYIPKKEWIGLPHSYNAPRIRTNENHSKEFLLHTLQSEYIAKQQRAWFVGAAQPFLDLNAISNFLIATPPTKTEQTAIAEALNDADALITELKKLIAKKKAIKHGAMQELLKPNEEWNWTTVEKLGKTYGGLSGKSKSDFLEGNCPYIPFMNIMSNPIIDKEYLDYVKISSSENQNRAQKGDLFFNGSSETPEEVGMCSVLLDNISNLYLNSFCFGFRLNKELNTDGLYLTYYFRSCYGRKIFYILAQGATRHNLSKSNFLKIEFQIPKPKDQTRIAQILSDMDIEIEALEKKLDKYKMLKQGMMQNLLTGKIRLI